MHSSGSKLTNIITIPDCQSFQHICQNAFFKEKNGRQIVLTLTCCTHVLVVIKYITQNRWLFLFVIHFF